jgi:endo-1,4-beta-xylanase
VFPNGGRSGYRGEVETMIVQELVPLIDRAYPTRGASARAVAGFSMGGAGAVRLSLLHPDLFVAAGSWGGGMWRDGEALVEAIRSHGPRMTSKGFGLLLINGDKDRPDAFDSLAEACKEAKVDHRVVVLPDTPHNLGLYYQRGGEAMADFLGRHLNP